MNLRSVARSLLPRGHKVHRIWRGPLRGRRIVTSWRDYPAAILGYTERELTTWLRANARTGETWLDVGAHYGYTSLTLCDQVGAKGRVLAFEPSLFTAGCLEKTRSLSRLWQWTILPLALSDTDRFSVERRAIVRGMIDSQIAPQEADGVTEMVAISLDRLWNDIAGPNAVVHGIKMDIQGMELKALSGMTNLLGRHRPRLVLEIHPGVERAAVVALLAQCGYHPNPIPLGLDPPSFFDIDCNHSFVFTGVDVAG